MTRLTPQSHLPTSPSPPASVSPQPSPLPDRLSCITALCLLSVCYQGGLGSAL